MHASLYDSRESKEYTWQNYSLGEMCKKARIDRMYLSTSIAIEFLRVNVETLRKTCLSDHYPIIGTLDIKDNKVRAH